MGLFRLARVMGAALGAATPALAEVPVNQALAPRPQLPPLDAYGDLPAVEQMALAADGKHLAAVAKVHGERRLLVLDEARSVKASMPLDNAKLRELAWCGVRQVCVTLSKTQSLGIGFTASHFEAFYTAVVPLDRGKPQFLFNNVPSVVPAVMGNYGFRTLGTKRFGYFGALQLRLSGDRIHYVFDKGMPTLFEVDMETLKFRKLAEAPERGSSRHWLIGIDGRVAAQFDFAEKSSTWTIKTKAGLILARGKDRLGDVSLVALGKDGSSLIYARGDEAAGTMKWYEVPLADGEEREFAPGATVRKVFLDPDDGRMLGYLPDDGEGAGQPVLFDPALQSKLRAVYRAFPKLNVEITDFTKGLTQVLVKTSGNSDPGTYYLVDLAARRADPVGDERPLIAAEMVGPISVIKYKASDGLEMDGVLTLPPGRVPKDLPVIMMPHGGPFGVDDRPIFDWWAQALASRGYAVFQPNYRGSGYRGADFEKAGYGQWGRKMQTDISDGLSELARQGIVNPKRACILGASYGGYAALAGVTLQKGLYRCAVAVAPVSDIGEMYKTNLFRSGGSALLRRTLDETLGPYSGFAAVSPRKHAAAADAPVMIIHGKDDTRVLFQQGERMVAALQDAKKPVEFVILPQEDHFLSRAETRKLMLTSSVRFVMTNNPPD